MQLALATVVATIAIGAAWYLNQTVSRRWRARGGPPPRCTVAQLSQPPPVSHMPRRVVAESESEEEETAAEEGPGHVAMGEDDTEALSAAPTAVHASNAAVHAPHGFGCTHLLELPDELLLLVLASLPVGRSHPLSLRAKRFERCRRGRAKPDFALTVCDVLAPVGVCCKAFANIVPEAASRFARYLGWTERWACPLSEYTTPTAQRSLAQRRLDRGLDAAALLTKARGRGCAHTQDALTHRPYTGCSALPIGVR